MAFFVVYNFVPEFPFRGEAHRFYSFPFLLHFLSSGGSDLTSASLSFLNIETNPFIKQHILDSQPCLLLVRLSQLVGFFWRGGIHILLSAFTCKSFIPHSPFYRCGNWGDMETSCPRSHTNKWQSTD